MIETTRCPRVIASINGSQTVSCLEMTITTVRSAGAATFRAEFDMRQLERDIGSSWQNQNSTAITLEVSTDGRGAATGGSMQTLLAGAIDHVSFEPHRRSLIVQGRDDAARLIDMPLSEVFLNKTSSEIARSLCSMTGLMGNIEDTTRLVGQYYQIEHNKGNLRTASRHANCWDLLSELADLEGFDLWVSTGTLNFRSGASGSTDARIVFHPDKNCYASAEIGVIGLSLSRMSQIVSPIQVVVESWNSRQRAIVRAQFPNTVPDGSAAYVVTRPNLLMDDANAIARSTYTKIRQQGQTLMIEAIGGTAVNSRSDVILQGVGAPWDGRYSILRNEYRYALRTGFTQQLAAGIAVTGD